MESVNTWEETRQGQVPPAAFRHALGRFGLGVTVVSVPHADGYHAMTANAFMSIPLEPPLVAVSIDLMGGQVQFARVDTPTAQVKHKAGKLKVLAAMSRTRLAAFSQVPTFAELLNSGELTWRLP